MDGDDDLLTRFAAGDPEAFVAFYRRHLAAVVAYLLRRTGDEELTADSCSGSSGTSRRRVRPSGGRSRANACANSAAAS